MSRILELVGHASVAQRQVALEGCIMAAKYKANHAMILDTAVYIDAEKKLSLMRLEEMTAGSCVFTGHAL